MDEKKDVPVETLEAPSPENKPDYSNPEPVKTYSPEERKQMVKEMARRLVIAHALKGAELYHKTKERLARRSSRKPSVRPVVKTGPLQ